MTELERALVQANKHMIAVLEDLQDSLTEINRALEKQ